MEVALPVNPTDFDFNASAYATAPSTPRFMGEYHFSAPTSPTRIPDLYSQFEQLLISESDTHQTNYCLATVPFAWEEKPGVPKSDSKFFDQAFAFDVSGELHRDSSVSAEDIFHGGVIKPAEIEHEQPPITPPPAAVNKVRERGRERSTSGLSSSRSRRTRSLPPFRGSELKSVTTTETTTTTAPTGSSSTTLSVFGSKKWSFKDLFLFRSVSDGRAMAKDPFKKYSSIFRKHDEDFRNSSLRHRSGSGSGSGSSKRRVPRVSAHELHYTVNRAVSIDMKKQTFLPYKQGILGRLAFNPTVHALSNGFGHSHNYLEMD